MEAHHYLGALAKIGHTLWYVATWNGQWLALLSFSAAAWKCAARDAWIGWDFRYQYDRLHLIANNSRFLILPEQHVAEPRLARAGLERAALGRDWQERFGYPLLLLETFVDPRLFPRHHLPCRQLALCGRHPRLSAHPHGLQRDGERRQARLCPPLARPSASPACRLPFSIPQYRHGAPNIMLSAEQMVSLPAFFADIPDPRRAQGRRHPLPAVLAIATAAILCGMRGYKAISLWAEDLGQKARARFRCRYRNGRYEVPSRTVIRDVLTRVDPMPSTAPCKAGTPSMRDCRRRAGHRRQDDVQCHR